MERVTITVAAADARHSEARVRKTEASDSKARPRTEEEIVKQITRASFEVKLGGSFLQRRCCRWIGVRHPRQGHQGDWEQERRDAMDGHAGQGSGISRPISLLLNRKGAQAVIAVLERLEYGVL